MTPREQMLDAATRDVMQMHPEWFRGPDTAAGVARMITENFLARARMARWFAAGWGKIKAAT
jgi:hypothetical protein